MALNRLSSSSGSSEQRASQTRNLYSVTAKGGDFPVKSASGSTSVGSLIQPTRRDFKNYRVHELQLTVSKHKMASCSQ